jgi:hypothetical protein
MACWWQVVPRRLLDVAERGGPLFTSVSRQLMSVVFVGLLGVGWLPNQPANQTHSSFTTSMQRIHLHFSRQWPSSCRTSADRLVNGSNDVERFALWTLSPRTSHKVCLFLYLFYVFAVLGLGLLFHQEHLSDFRV